MNERKCYFLFFNFSPSNFVFRGINYCVFCCIRQMELISVVLITVFSVLLARWSWFQYYWLPCFLYYSPGGVDFSSIEYLKALRVDLSRKHKTRELDAYCLYLYVTLIVSLYNLFFIILRKKITNGKISFKEVTHEESRC